MKANSVVWLLVASLTAIDVQAEERVYSTVDAQGRVQMIKSEITPKTQPVIVPPSKATEKTQSPPVTSQGSSSNAAFRQLDDDVYVDSEYLEQKSYNLEDKKRVYYVPNGGFGQQIVESDDGEPITPVISQTKEQKRQATYSASYQTLSPEWLEANGLPLKKFCNNTKKLKKQARAFKDVNALWLGSDDKIASDVDRILVLPQLTVSEQNLRISSFATTNKKPKFYVPIVTFLDAQGCMVSGAWQYWSQAYPATENQFSAVEGLLRLPVGTQYIVFSRPMTTVAVDLPLQNTGSLIVEYY